MRRFAVAITTVLASITLTACGAPARGPVVITISYQGDSIAVVPDSVVVERGRQVRWEADEGLKWIAAFAAESPFQNGRSVFSSDPGGDSAPIDPTAPEEAFKYSVFVAVDGAWIEKDPKLVIIDDGGGQGDTIDGGN